PSPDHGDAFGAGEKAGLAVADHVRVLGLGVLRTTALDVAHVPVTSSPAPSLFARRRRGRARDWFRRQGDPLGRRAGVPRARRGCPEPTGGRSSQPGPPGGAGPGWGKRP